MQSLFEKLQLTDERNLLIQGLPSTIEKQFCKLSFAKNVTPLLKTRRIDFALIFVVNERQLNSILSEVLPALKEDAKLWIAYPKQSSKITTDLNRDCSWNYLQNEGFETVRIVALDHVWSALRFTKKESMDMNEEDEGGEVAVAVDTVRRVVTPPADFMRLLSRNKPAVEFFESLSYTNKKEYIVWITGAKKEDTRLRRVELAVDKLIAGKKNPSDK